MLWTFLNVSPGLPTSTATTTTWAGRSDVRPPNAWLPLYPRDTRCCGISMQLSHPLSFKDSKVKLIFLHLNYLTLFNREIQGLNLLKCYLVDYIFVLIANYMSVSLIIFAIDLYIFSDNYWSLISKICWSNGSADLYLMAFECQSITSWPSIFWELANRTVLWQS